jgi:hypothetical protein
VRTRRGNLLLVQREPSSLQEPGENQERKHNAAGLVQGEPSPYQEPGENQERNLPPLRDWFSENHLPTMNQVRIRRGNLLLQGWFRENHHPTRNQVRTRRGNLPPPAGLVQGEPSPYQEPGENQERKPSAAGLV